MVSMYKTRRREGSNPACTVTSRVAKGWSRGCKAASPVRAWISVVFPGGKRVRPWYYCQPPKPVPHPPSCTPASSPQLVYPTTDTTGNSRRTRSLRISLRLSRSRSRILRSRSSRSLSARARSSVGDSPGRTSDTVGVGGRCGVEPIAELWGLLWSRSFTSQTGGILPWESHTSRSQTSVSGQAACLSRILGAVGSEHVLMYISGLRDQEGS